MACIKFGVIEQSKGIQTTRRGSLGRRETRKKDRR